MGSTQYRFSDAPHSTPARLRIGLLGIWAGALLAFGGLFVPAAFSHLPTQLAAAVLGEGFAALDRYGIALGLGCLALGFVDRRVLGRRGGADLLRIALPLAGVFAHLTSWVWVTPVLQDLRAAAGGAIGTLPADSPASAQFALLHSVSRGLFGLAAGSACLALLWDLWRVAPGARSGASPDAENP